MTGDELKNLIESLIFAAESPLSIEKLSSIIEGAGKEELKEAIGELSKQYCAGGLRLENVAGGFQIRTAPEFSPWIKRLFSVTTQKISRPALETLAMVAYKQPITRAEIEAVRGVDSSGVLTTLLEKGLVKIAGRKDEPGRPHLYSTTRGFLEVFGLKDLASLPTLKEMDFPQERSPGKPEHAGEYKATPSEDNSQSGDNLEEKGGGTDPSGKGEGK
jgi:segregation and condensation protein B